MKIYTNFGNKSVFRLFNKTNMYLSIVSSQHCVELSICLIEFFLIKVKNKNANLMEFYRLFYIF